MAGVKVVEAIGPTYHLADRKAAVQSAINCFPQKLDGTNWMMASAPGEVQIANLGAEIRGSRNVEGRWFVVAGTTLYEMRADGSASVRGSIVSNSGFIGMSHNRSQLALVDGNDLYIFTLATNTLTQITAAGWRGSNDVHELDGYFIFVDPDTDQFYVSAIDDGASLDALDFSSADSSPDNILAHCVSHRQAWFFGTQSTEIWINSGALDFPFVRYQSYTLEVGIVGERALITAADTVFWVGQNRSGAGIVYMAAGNQPRRVSTLAIEEALRGADLSTCSMWSYQVEGHEFIGVNADGLSSTLVFDAATEQWHERAEWDAGWAPWQSRLVTAYQEQHFAGTADGKVVRLDANVNTYNGRPLVRERTWPHLVQPSLEPTSFRSLEIACKSGNGGNMTLEISNDGGYNFGAPLLRSLGVTGRWMQRVRWLGLGAAFNRVFRLRCSDDVPFGIYSAAVDA